MTRKPGRPRILPPGDEGEVSFTLPGTMHQAIVDAADRQRVSIAEWLRGAVALRLKRDAAPAAARPRDDDPPLIVG